MKNNEIKKSYSPLKSWLQEWIASASELSTSQDTSESRTKSWIQEWISCELQNSRTKNNSTNIHLPRLTVQISIEQRFKSTTVNQASSNGGYAILGVLAESEQCPICQSYNSNPP